MCLDLRHIRVEPSGTDDSFFDMAPHPRMEDVEHLVACTACPPFREDAVSFDMGAVFFERVHQILDSFAAVGNDFADRRPPV